MTAPDSLAILPSIADEAAAPGSGRGRGHEVVHPTLAGAHAAFHVPSAFVSDGVAYLTGVIAALEEGEDPQTGRPAAFARAFRQIGEVLEGCGATWDDVVKITSFHLDVGADIRAMAEAKDAWCRKPYPAWSVLGAGSLANPAGLCEIEIIAHLPQPPRA